MTRNSLIPRWLAPSAAACVLLAGCGEGGDAETPSTPATNAAPQISGTPPTSVTQGERYAFKPTVIDANNDPLTFSISNKPAWAVFSTSTGEIDGTPTDGTFTDIVISVSDGQHVTSLEPFTIDVATPGVGNAPPSISGTPPTAVTEGQVYAFTPDADDPDGDSLTFTASNLPPWASFSAGTGSVGGSPTAEHVGAYSDIVIRVSDGQAEAELATFAIVVLAAGASNSPPTISGTPSASVTAGQSYAFTPGANDPDGNPLTFTATNLPAWASFNAATGRIAGTPTAAHVGAHGSIVISVSDGQADASLAPFGITVNPASVGNSLPTISGAPSATVTAGQSYSFVPNAADADGNSLTFSIANRPAWASFNSSTGRLSGTPAAANVGTYRNIAISVSDGVASASLAPFSVTVQTANRAPVISGNPPAAVTPGQPYSFTPAASDADGNSLTFSISNRPSWAAFNAGTGRLNGTPTTANVGSYGGIVITVSDGQASASLAPFAITVNAASSANRPPAISGTPPTTVAVGQSYAFTPTASDADADSLTFTVSNLPVWASFSAATGRISGTPTTSHVGTYNNIAISVSDGQVTASLAAFGITVQPGNRAPTISGAAPTSVTSGQTYSFTPTASDPDGNSLTFSITNRPAWATFNANTGQLSGTPAAANVGTYGNIVIRVSDGQATASLAAFGITVQAVNGAPAISGTPSTTAAAGQAYAFTPTGNDPDGNTLTFTVTNLPSWAGFNASTGRLSGTPTAAHVGVYDNIVVSVSDGQIGASLPAFAITVTAATTGSVTLSWTPPTTNSDGSPLTDFAGYRIYWGTSPTNFPNSVTVDNAGLSSYVVEQLTPATWYFVVTAFHAHGTESNFSNVASKTIQ
jgi:hypothetical protein